ncbi:MAG: cysteine synthase family protein [Herpetosiphonaceae bacterium]|nr:cysteine synthase family protein [Herpetosiphonaceae bacterium]
MLRNSMIESIGNTPLVKLRLEDRAIGNVYAKLEMLNPYGMKDRVAKQIILEAKRSGILKDDAPIIESSSGTMALGVALVGTYLGHSVHIVTDPRMDMITMVKLQSLGCIVHVVERMTSQGWQSARLERLAELLEASPGAFWPQQYENPNNPLAYAELARELIDDIGRVDILIGSVGSGGSLCGTARALRTQQAAPLRVIGLDAVGSFIFGQPDRPTRLQSGLGNSLIPANVDFSVIDEVHWLSDEEAFAATHELVRHEKIFAGNSSGSTYAVARWLGQRVPAGTNIVAIFPDRGDRYFSTFYNRDYLEQKGIQSLRIPEAPQHVQRDVIVNSWSYCHLHEGQ